MKNQTPTHENGNRPRVGAAPACDVRFFAGRPIHMVAGLPTLKAGPCAHDTLPPVYFFLTSTPDRAARLPKLMASLRQQTLRPHAVVLTIARRYDAQRFNSTTFVVPSLEVDGADAGTHTRRGRGRLHHHQAKLGPPVRLIVHTLDTDQGPISKYYGATSAAIEQPDRAIAVVADDDMFYGKTFVEDYACAVAGSRGAEGAHAGGGSAPSARAAGRGVADGGGSPAGSTRSRASREQEAVFSSGIDLDCGKLRGCVMGFRGVGMRVSALRALPSTPIPRACFLADDVAITHYLTRLRGLAIWRLKLRSRYKFDDEFAWYVPRACCVGEQRPKPWTLISGLSLQISHEQCSILGQTCGHVHVHTCCMHMLHMVS